MYLLIYCLFIHFKETLGKWIIRIDKNFKIIYLLCIDFYMKKINKFIITFLFVLIWLIFCSFIERYWRVFHWEFIFLNIRTIFDHIFWFSLQKFLFDFDLGFYLEELLKFVTYELPKEFFKYIPIYFVLRNIWTKK